MNLSQHPTPAFRPAHQWFGGPHSSYAFLGSSKTEGECKRRSALGESYYLDARVETANAKGKLLSSQLKQVCPPPKESISHLKGMPNPLQRKQSAKQFKINQAQQQIHSVQCEHWQVTLVYTKTLRLSKVMLRRGREGKSSRFSSKSDKLTWFNQARTTGKE